MIRKIRDKGRKLKGKRGKYGQENKKIDKGKQL